MNYLGIHFPVHYNIYWYFIYILMNLQNILTCTIIYLNVVSRYLVICHYLFLLLLCKQFVHHANSLKGHQIKLMSFSIYRIYFVITNKYWKLKYDFPDIFINTMTNFSKRILLKFIDLKEVSS